MYLITGWYNDRNRKLVPIKVLFPFKKIKTVLDRGELIEECIRWLKVNVPRHGNVWVYSICVWQRVSEEEKAKWEPVELVKIKPMMFKRNRIRIKIKGEEFRHIVKEELKMSVKQFAKETGIGQKRIYAFMGEKEHPRHERRMFLLDFINKRTTGMFCVGDLFTVEG